MLRTLKDGLKSFRFLLNFKDYRSSEIVIKSLLLVIVLPIFTGLWIITLTLYCIERLLSPIFKVFIYVQIKLIQARNFAGKWKMRGIGVLNLIVTLAFLPLIVLYYSAMLLKILVKTWLKAMIIKLDYSVQYQRDTMVIFDDYARGESVNFSTLMKDAPQTQALHHALESYFQDVDDENSPKNIE